MLGQKLLNSFSTTKNLIGKTIYFEYTKDFKTISTRKGKILEIKNYRLNKNNTTILNPCFVLMTDKGIKNFLIEKITDIHEIK